MKPLEPALTWDMSSDLGTASLELALTQGMCSDLSTASLYCNLESSLSQGTQKTLEHVLKIETYCI